MPGRRRGWAAAGVVAATMLTAGCGSVRERQAAATTAALGFEQAVRVRDGAAICAVLAPGTRQELEQSSKSPCPRAVLDQEIPPGSQVRRVDVYGHQARVVLASDTVFLSLFSGRWKVTAAGCSPRPQMPYECTLKGG